MRSGGRRFAHVFAGLPAPPSARRFCSFLLLGALPLALFSVRTLTYDEAVHTSTVFHVDGGARCRMTLSMKLIVTVDNTDTSTQPHDTDRNHGLHRHECTQTHDTEECM